MARVEPELEMVRRALPLSVPALAVALLLGAVLGGPGAAASAALGVAIVFLNFAAYGVSLAYAARISLTVLFAVGLGGYIVRLGIVVVVILGLEQLAWFSVVAFVAALVPTTIALLVFEIKLMSGRMQADLWTLPAEPREAGR